MKKDFESKGMHFNRKCDCNIQEKIAQNKDDPMIVLGPGINNYHLLLRVKFWMFFVLLILNLQTLRLYRSFDFYADEGTATSDMLTGVKAGLFASNSVGNMGFS